MAERSTKPGRMSLGTVLMYGVALGLLLAALQFGRYRFMVLDNAQELYIGLIALVFTVVGIWAGNRITLRHPSSTPAPAALQPLEGPDLDRVLEKLTITRREYEVLQHIAQGLSNQEIADRMFVSLNTIKTHTSNLFSKLDAQRRTQAVQKARALGLLASAHPKV